MGPERVIVLLAFLSGVCGLAYEVLYTRLLTTYLGDMMQVSAGVLATFLLGLAAGSVSAHRLYRWLWAVEGAIGVYGAVVALILPDAAPLLLTRLLPLTSGSAPALIAVVCAVVAVPSFLIGCTVPLFSAYLNHASGSDDEADGFAWIYLLYNLGAGTCVLALEFWLMRRLGLRDAMFAIAALNLVTSLALKFRVAEPERFTALRLRALFTGATRDGLIVLMFVSAASALYQLLILRLICAVFGPFHENFALLLAMVMFGLAIASWLVRRWQTTLASWLTSGGAIVALGLVLLPEQGRLWALLSEATTGDPTSRAAAKCVVMALMALPALVVVGGTVPAWLRQVPDQRDAPGKALAVSSFGNCVGYLLAIFVILEGLDYVVSFTLAALVCAAGGGVLLRRRPWGRVRAVVPTAALVLFAATRWPTAYFSLDAADFVDSAHLRAALLEFSGAEQIKRFDSEVSIVRTRDGSEYVNIGGYTSFIVAANGAPNHREIIVGVAPALYAPARGRVLVLGTGTGVTAGAAAAVFDHATVVEINPAVFAALPRFSDYNFDLVNKRNVEFLLADGLGVVAKEGPGFDAIISTVTTPLYFSSSKLYTHDFFEMVRARLNDRGVFAFWFDGRLSHEGTAVILETMGQSFAHCDFAFLNRGYYMALCSDELLTPRPLRQWPADITRALGHRSVDGQIDVDVLLDHLLVRPAVPLSEVRWADAPNTFDLPVLEHLMAREALRPVSEWDLDGWLRFRLDESLLGGEAYHGTRLVERCHTMAKTGASYGLPRCDAIMRESDGGQLWLDYLERVAAAVLARREAGMHTDTLVPELLQVGKPELALDVLNSLPSRALSPMFHHLRQMLALQLHKKADDGELAALFSRAPLSTSVRRLLLDVSLSRGDETAALAHLGVLARLGRLTPREVELRASLRAGGSQ